MGDSSVGSHLVYREAHEPFFKLYLPPALVVCGVRFENLRQRPAREVDLLSCERPRRPDPFANRRHCSVPQKRELEEIELP